MPWKRMLLYLCIIAAARADEDAATRVVKTTQGSVRGFLDPDGGLFAFYGIPYAVAPKGHLKFKAPLPPPMWLETLEAVDKHVICPQSKSLLTQSMSMQEDCLIANVFVPDTKETKLPVIVYIHGGAFQIGFGNQLTPKNLARSQNIIAVTFNYRLGAHGFLCLGTDDAAGNAGLKDQVAALRWVKKNIAKFGGNPDDVTIAGYSAGASSVDLLTVSKSAEGLFNKAIIESGSNLMGAAVVTDPLENAKIFASSLGFTNLDDVYALEDFYKAAPYDTLTSIALMDRTNSTLLFAPCIERDTQEKEFLTEAPFDILKKKSNSKVPMLYGFSNMEGLFREPYYEDWKIKMNEKFSDFLPGDLQFENDQEKEKVAKEVKEFYFGDAIVNEKNILSYIDYFSDAVFNYPVLRTVKMRVENGNDKVYLYEYSFVDENVPVVPHTAELRGATHCAQTFAVLDRDHNITKEFKEVKKVIRSFWANFVRTGTPTPEGSDLPAWLATGAGWSPHMEIARPPALRGELLPLRARMWGALYERYYRPPGPPPPPPPPPATHTEL